MWKMYLQGKIAVISGGARGLGRAYTEAILKAGGKVLIRSNPVTE
jgi:NAD(P)-dependent dehydrogenase (short-subunit alcohol dehydrogenase family)